MFDAVFDAAVLVGPALAAVRDGGSYLGVRSSDIPEGPRGITIAATSHHDGARLAGLLALVVAGELPTRVAGTCRWPMPPRPMRTSPRVFSVGAGCCCPDLLIRLARPAPHHQARHRYVTGTCR